MAYSEFGGRRYPYYPHHAPNFSVQRPCPARAIKLATAITIVVLALWSSTTTAYLLLRDDALKFLATRQTEMVRSYDEQLTLLEGEIERLKSLKLIDQERVDRAVHDLTRRQTEVEKRQSLLATINLPKEMTRIGQTNELTSSIPSIIPSIPETLPKPSPISDTIYFRPPSDRSAELQSRPIISSSIRYSDSPPANQTEARIIKLGRGLEQIAARQGQSLNRLEEGYERREEQLRRVLTDLGVPAPTSSTTHSNFGIGGPLLSLGKSGDPFEQQIARIRSAAETTAKLDDFLEAVPVRRPVPLGAEVTSGFGVRLDPFIRQYAMHSGVDFKGYPGDSVRATAAGRVTTADYQGGYGLMVELDHGNGLVTRYGHLSAINVAEGQWVQTGETVGRLGTTGRSTGPHLHYEVRVAGEAVDPQLYLRAGVRLNTSM
jgi:murein DD-endopeptidase MepM/ murein hydrolase activator NlpD